MTDHQAPQFLTPAEEAARLEALYALRILDTAPEQAFDELAHLAQFIAKTPLALITFIDSDRQWFKAKRGTDISETPLICSFCLYTIPDPSRPLIINDTLADERFASNPVVVGEPHIRFYCGVPLVTRAGHVLGTLCVHDLAPRELDQATIDVLCMLGRQVMWQIELRQHNDMIERKAQQDQSRYLSHLEAYQRRLEEANHRLAAASLTDRLTGIGNRAALDDGLNEHVQRARHHHYALSILMLDIDHFKKFNDKFGHLAGDDLLRDLAHLLQDVGRHSDWVARYGGEEFVLILPQTTRQEAWLVAERIRRRVECHAFKYSPITVSIGIATLSEQYNDEHALLLAADQALYAVKNSQRNRCIHRDEM